MMKLSVMLRGTVAVVLIASVSSCGRRSTESPKSGAAVEIKAAGPALPRMVLSINGGEKEVRKGEAMVLEASIFHPGAMSEETVQGIELKNSGGWRGLISVESRPEKISFQQELSGAEDSITLDKTHYGSVRWTLSPDQSAQLKPGKYELILKLGPFSGSPWKEAATSAPYELTVAEGEPRDLRSEIEYHAAKGDRDAALSAADKHLEKNPEDASVMTVKGDLLAKSGKKQEALAAYGNAIEVYEKAGSTRPPEWLARKYNAAMGAFVESQPETVDESVPYQSPNNYEIRKNSREVPQKGAPGAEPEAGTPAKPAAAPEEPETTPAENEPAQTGQMSSVLAEGEIRIVLSWAEPVDLDLRVEDESGGRYAPGNSVSKGPGSETVVLKSEEMSGKYYAAAALIGMRGARASARMRVEIPGRPAAETSAEMVYDGEHQNWIAFVIDTGTWQVKKAAAFGSSVPAYIQKEQQEAL